MKVQKFLQRALTAVENVDIEFFSVLGNDLTLFIQSMINLTELNNDE